MQTNKYWLLICRHGDERILYPGNRAGFDAARSKQDDCNGGSPEDIFDSEYDDIDDMVSGSFEQGYFSIDEGGSLELLEVENV